MYISFVGTFNEVDEDYELIDQAEVGAYLDEVWGDDYDPNPRESQVKAEHYVLCKRLEGFELLDERVKDSLTVSVYADPEGNSGWGVVVAECMAGGWFDAARVNLASYEANAAVPAGAEVNITSGERK